MNATLTLAEDRSGLERLWVRPSLRNLNDYLWERCPVHDAATDVTPPSTRASCLVRKKGVDGSRAAHDKHRGHLELN